MVRWCAWWEHRLLSMDIWHGGGWFRLRFNGGQHHQHELANEHLSGPGVRSQLFPVLATLWGSVLLRAYWWFLFFYYVFFYYNYNFSDKSLFGLIHMSLILIMCVFYVNYSGVELTRLKKPNCNPVLLQSNCLITIFQKSSLLYTLVIFEWQRT